MAKKGVFAMIFDQDEEGGLLLRNSMKPSEKAWRFYFHRAYANDWAECKVKAWKRFHDIKEGSD